MQQHLLCGKMKEDKQIIHVFAMPMLGVLAMAIFLGHMVLLMGCSQFLECLQCHSENHADTTDTTDTPMCHPIHLCRSLAGYY